MADDAQEVVESYFPAYERHRAPLITFDGEKGVSVAMPPVGSFEEVDKTAAPLLDYSDPDAFVPNKPVPPSAISWPGGDGRGNVIKSRTGSFTQPNLKEYGPFPDFYKVRKRLIPHSIFGWCQRQFCGSDNFL